MNIIRLLHPFRFVLRALLIAASVAGMLFRLTSPGLAAKNMDFPNPVSQNSAVQIAPAGVIQEDENLDVTAGDDQGITLQLSTPDFTIEQKSVAGQTCQAIHIENYGATENPGWPELPVRGAMVGIPVQSNPTLVIVEARPVVLDGEFRLCPVEAPTPDQVLPGDLPPYEEQPAWDAQAYGTLGFQPQAAAELANTAYLRDQHIAQLRFYPFQYNPANGQLQYFANIVVRLSFNEIPVESRLENRRTATTPQKGAFDELLQTSLINYQQALSWRSEPESVRALQTTSPSTLQQPVYKLFVEKNGIYQVTYESLAAIAGEELQPGQAANTFRLFTGGDFTRGQEIAIQVQDGGDGSFNPGDAILFYGQAVNTQYTGANVYYLTWGDMDGLRMVIVDGAPTGGYDNPDFRNSVHVEQNLSYVCTSPSGASKDVWYWNYLLGSDSKTYTTTLESIAADSTGTVRVSGLLQSHSGTSQHHTRIYLNGYLIDDVLWPIYSTYVFTQEVPQSYLVEGVNSITVEALLDNGITSGIVLINWFEIEYWDTLAAENDALSFKVGGSGTINPQITGFSTNQVEIFDITNPNQTARLVGYAIVADNQGYSLVFKGDPSMEHVYIVQSTANRLSPQKIVRDTVTTLHSTSNAADYIIITHADFLSTVQPLADWRAAQGLRTKVIDVADIYDEFGSGLISPQSIHDFLAYAYANWQTPAPLYVVLFGDGNFDPRNYLGTGTPTFIPPYLEFVDYWIGQNASENRFVTVSGNDHLPDMFLGRIPVASQVQASAAVTKILAYEQNPPATNWNSNVLFIADNADSAGNFPYYSDLVVNGYLPTDYTPQKVYYGTTHTTVASARTAIWSGINNGALIVNYVGHGLGQTWASENLFSIDTVATLSNANMLPFVNSMSCLVSFFTYPDLNGVVYNSLAEQFVLSANGGAIATFASAGLGLASGQDYLNRGLFQAVFQENLTQVGSATTRAKLYLYANTGGYQDAIDLFHLLGDPATRLNVLLPLPASLGDRVWEDSNANGVQDANEPGLAGVSASLYTLDGNLAASAVTDPQGLYAFDNIPAGSYYLVFPLPDGYSFSPLNPSAGNEMDSNIDPSTGRSAIFVLSAGQNDLSQDAGMVRLASLGDRVWEDSNANGVQDANEPGLADVSASLYTLDGDLAASAVTDPQGLYAFDNIPAGSYYLVFSLPDGYSFSPLNPSAGNEMDSNIDPSTGKSAIFVLGIGQNDLSQDVGMYRLASLGDRVWGDKNGNGIQDPRETGIRGVQVGLYTTAGNLVATTITDKQGNYMFANITPGSYYLVFSLPHGYLFSPMKQTADPNLDSDANPRNGSTAIFTLGSGQQDFTWDAGLNRAKQDEFQRYLR